MQVSEERRSRVLCVDDEPNVLEAVRRHLARQFAVSTATGGAEALELIRRDPPFEVVISDMQMPGMDGISFLGRVRQASPGTVRILLTGNGGLPNAIAAVNEGRIFQFLTKPCPPDVLTKAVEAAVEQHHLAALERELLEKTVSGCVRLLTEVLSLVNPVAFGRAMRIRSYARQMAERLGLADVWQYEMAGMLSQIGCVTVPTETLEKVFAGQVLSEREREQFGSHPRVGRTLLQEIPRFEVVARMVEGQQRSFRESAAGRGDDLERRAALGAQMLRVALDLDELVARGTTSEIALARMRREEGVYNPDLLAALAEVRLAEDELVAGSVCVRELTTLMVLGEDVRTRGGLVVVPKGQEVTYPVLERVRRFAEGAGVVEPIRVLIRKY